MSYSNELYIPTEQEKYGHHHEERSEQLILPKPIPIKGGEEGNSKERRGKNLGCSTLPHTCPICNQIFPTKHVCHTHIETAHGPKIQCDVCNKVFTRRITLEVHKRKVHGLQVKMTRNRKAKSGAVVGERRGYCTFCHTWITRKALLWTHIIKKHEAEAVNLALHDLTTGAQVFSCNNCDKVFLEIKLLEHHQALSHNVVYKCQICNTDYLTKASLKGHLIMVHYGTLCPDCGKPHCVDCITTNTKSDPIADNGNNNVEDPSEFSCPECKKAFQRNCDLQRHLASHTKPIVCEICQQRFSRTNHLRVHKEKAHKEKVENSVACSWCPFAASCRRYLHRHLVSAHDNRIQKNTSSSSAPAEIQNLCPICGKEFLYKVYLETHEKIFHTAKHRCPVCKEEFPTRNTYLTHFDNVHQEEEAKIQITCTKCGIVNCSTCEGEGWQSEEEEHQKLQSEKIIITKPKRKAPPRRSKPNPIKSAVAIKSKEYLCERCRPEKYFATWYDLRRHYKRRHPAFKICRYCRKLNCEECVANGVEDENRPKFCPVCPKSYKLIEEVREHCKTDHPEVKFSPRSILYPKKTKAAQEEEAGTESSSSDNDNGEETLEKSERVLRSQTKIVSGKKKSKKAKNNSKKPAKQNINKPTTTTNASVSNACPEQEEEEEAPFDSPVTFFPDDDQVSVTKDNNANANNSGQDDWNDDSFAALDNHDYFDFDFDHDQLSLPDDLPFHNDGNNQSLSEDKDIKEDRDAVIVHQGKEEIHCQICTAIIPAQDFASHIELNHNKNIKVGITRMMFRTMYYRLYRTISLIQPSDDNFNIPWYICEKCGFTSIKPYAVLDHKTRICPNKALFAAVSKPDPFKCIRLTYIDKLAINSNETPNEQQHKKVGGLELQMGAWTEQWNSGVKSVIDEDTINTIVTTDISPNNNIMPEPDKSSSSPQSPVMERIEGTSCYKLICGGTVSKLNHIQFTKLQQHLQSHGKPANEDLNPKQQQIFICEFCGKQLSTKGGYIGHINVHNGIKPYKCRFCDKCYPSPMTRWIHEDYHHHINPPTRNSILTGGTEEEQQSTPKEYNCNICTRSFPTKSIYKYHHKYTHPKDGPIICPICTKPYKSKLAFKSHHRTVHGENCKRKLSKTCIQCGKTVKGKKSLERHMIIFHYRPKNPLDKNIKFFNCKYCDKGFSLIITMRNHLRTQHQDILPQELMTQNRTRVIIPGTSNEQKELTLTLEDYFIRRKWSSFNT